MNENFEKDKPHNITENFENYDKQKGANGSNCSFWEAMRKVASGEIMPREKFFKNSMFGICADTAYRYNSLTNAKDYTANNPDSYFFNVGEILFFTRHIQLSYSSYAQKAMEFLDRCLDSSAASELKKYLLGETDALPAFINKSLSSPKGVSLAILNRKRPGKTNPYVKSKFARIDLCNENTYKIGELEVEKTVNGTDVPNLNFHVECSDSRQASCSDKAMEKSEKVLNAEKNDIVICEASTDSVPECASDTGVYTVSDDFLEKEIENPDDFLHVDLTCIDSDMNLDSALIIGEREVIGNVNRLKESAVDFKSCDEIVLLPDVLHTTGESGEKSSHLSLNDNSLRSLKRKKRQKKRIKKIPVSVKQPVIEIHSDDDVYQPDAPYINITSNDVVLDGAIRVPSENEAHDMATNQVSSDKNQFEMDILNEFRRFSGVTTSRFAVYSTSVIKELKVKSLDAFNRLDDEIWRHHHINSQNTETFAWKMRAKDKLLHIIRSRFPSAFIYVVGSSINGCGSYNCDMDLCLCVSDAFHNYTTSRNFEMAVLKSINATLSRHREKSIKSSNIIPAKVPLVKLCMNKPFNDLEVDINCNNISGIYNTHLIHHYSRIDSRFPSLCLVIKHWAIVSGINDPMYGTLNSYSLVLMVMHYLQCGTFPPVLPNLLEIYPLEFSTQIPIDSLKLFHPLPFPLPDHPVNDLTVGELLIGFFHYYSKFNFNDWAISISKGCVLTRNDSSICKMFIEDPYDFINTARCVIRNECMNEIRNEFLIAYNALIGDKSFEPSLSSINVLVT